MLCTAWRYCMCTIVFLLRGWAMLCTSRTFFCINQLLAYDSASHPIISHQDDDIFDSPDGPLPKKVCVAPSNFTPVGTHGTADASPNDVLTIPPEYAGLKESGQSFAGGFVEGFNVTVRPLSEAYFPVRGCTSVRLSPH